MHDSSVICRSPMQLLCLTNRNRDLEVTVDSCCLLLFIRASQS